MTESLKTLEELNTAHAAQTYMRQNEFEALHKPLLMLNSDALACMYMQALGPDKNVAL